MKTRSHILFALILFYYITPVFSQENFKEDSIAVTLKMNEVLAYKTLPSEDSLYSILSKNTEGQSAKLNDFIYFTIGKIYFYRNDLSKAEYIVQKLLNDDFNENSSDAKYYNLQGAIYSVNKRSYDAIRSFLKAASLLRKKGDRLQEHIIYNNIANIYLGLGDHHQAYYYSNKCVEVIANHPEHPSAAAMVGVLVICENNLGLLDSAKIHLQLGFEMLSQNNQIVGEITLQYAQAEWYYLNQQFEEAKPHALKSVEISEKYSVFDNQLIGEVLLMKIHNDQGLYENAIHYGLKAKETYKKSKNETVLSSIYDGLAIANAKVNNYKLAFGFKNAADSLKSIDRDKSNKMVIDSLLVQFESLKDKNLILEQDAMIIKQNQKIERRNNTVIITSISIFFLVILMVIIIMYNKQRIKSMQRNHSLLLLDAIRVSEERERDRISSELHDGLAAELTALKLHLEFKNVIDDAEKEMLKNAHQMVRRIAHNLSPKLIEEKGLVEATRFFVNSLNTKIKIHFYTNIKAKLNFKKQTETILYRSIQEVIQNALKHSEAKSLSVQIINTGSIVNISIEDDGIGVDESQLFNSIGFSGIKSRLELLGAEINIDTEKGKGTTIYISLKLEHHVK